MHVYTCAWLFFCAVGDHCVEHVNVCMYEFHVYTCAWLLLCVVVLLFFCAVYYCVEHLKVCIHEFTYKCMHMVVCLCSWSLR